MVPKLWGKKVSGLRVRPIVSPQPRGKCLPCTKGGLSHPKDQTLMGVSLFEGTYLFGGFKRQAGEGQIRVQPKELHPRASSGFPASRSEASEALRRGGARRGDAASDLRKLPAARRRRPGRDLGRQRQAGHARFRGAIHGHGNGRGGNRGAER